MHTHKKDITYQGQPLAQASKAIIMIHGRGANPDSILGLANYLQLDDFALIAPAATQRTWYPYSFMAPVVQNEPSLSSALELIDAVVQEALAAGLQTENIYFLGFSQGACLASEYVARNAQRYGGLFVYSGGLIGAELNKENYQGDFQEMPVIIGCSDRDAHIPLQRVKDSSAVFAEMGAQVTERIYPNGAHTIYEDELELTNEVLGES